MKTALCVISFYHGRMRGAASSRFNSLKKIIVKSPCSQYQKYFFRSPSMLTTYLYLILQKINYSTSIKIYAKPNGSNSCLSFSRKLLIGRAKKFVLNIIIALFFCEVVIFLFCIFFFRYRLEYKYTFLISSPPFLLTSLLKYIKLLIPNAFLIVELRDLPHQNSLSQLSAEHGLIKNLQNANKIITVSKVHSDYLQRSMSGNTICCVEHTFQHLFPYSVLAKKFHINRKNLISKILNNQTLKLFLCGTIYPQYSASILISHLSEALPIEIHAFGLNTNSVQNLTVESSTNYVFHDYEPESILYKKIEDYDMILNFSWPDKSVTGSKLVRYFSTSVPIFTFVASESFSSELTECGSTVIITKKIIDICSSSFLRSNILEQLRTTIPSESYYSKTSYSNYIRELTCI